MRRLSSLEEIGWIKNGVTPSTPDTEGHHVSQCIPSIFQAYAKLFHPIYEDVTVSNADVTWNKIEKSARSAPTIPTGDTLKDRIRDVVAQSTLVYGGPGSDSQLVRVRWKDLAHRQGIPFVPTLSAWSFTRLFADGSWPRRLIGPAEGDLAKSERNALAAVLRRHINVPRCLFHFLMMATVDWKDDLLFEGTLDEISSFPDPSRNARLSPTHSFPEDHAWIIYTDYDLTFTLIGGSASLVGELLYAPDLECVSVSPDTRIDRNADAVGTD